MAPSGRAGTLGQLPRFVCAGDLILCAYICWRSGRRARWDHQGTSRAVPHSRLAVVGPCRWVRGGGRTRLPGKPLRLQGALFPLELFPKITRWGGPYKALIIEFVDLREYIQRQGLPALGSLYTRITCFLLLAMPLSFLVLAAWRAARSGRSSGSVQCGPSAGFVPLAWPRS